MENILKKIRHKQGLSLEMLSEMCGVSKSQIHELEKQDSHCPKLITAYAISMALSETVLYIWPNPLEHQLNKEYKHGKSKS